MYANATDKRYAEAASWFRKAAKQGLEGAAELAGNAERLLRMSFDLKRK